MIKPRKQKLTRKEVDLIPLEECLAKTLGHQAGVSVETHCRIVGSVAREMIRRLPEWLRNEFFSDGSELVAAAHDIGKVSPGFQEKIYRSIGKRRGIVGPELDKIIGYHFAVSQAAAAGFPKYIPEILGRHHGSNPPSVDSSDAEKYGGPAWQRQRLELIASLKDHFKTDWPVISTPLQADVLAGLTVIADWIGSGSLFDDPPEFVDERSVLALDRAGFIRPKIRRALSFESIFSGYRPHDIQSRFIESVNRSGVYVLEAPMGLGKTEAALYAAYNILQKKLATGIYFALPTQLTSDRIYDRFNDYLKKILDAREETQSALLLHSLAWLKNTEMGEEGSPGHSWFNGSKRGLLAPFAVGTIDQALMAVMNVRHGFLRTFGLAGKVVILDEIHSYDSYTGTLVRELVGALRELHCTVIILSATLTHKQRYDLLELSFNGKDVKESTGYPLVSSCPRGGQLKEISASGPETARVDVCLCGTDLDAWEEALLRAHRGEQVLWIENTVKDAQEIYRYLAARIGNELEIACGLMHSRFVKADRQHNEDNWVKIFGKSAQVLRKEKGRILVGTQVLEQSLDIDADFLVTRICPTDMLFQRMGRLWRHRGNDSLRPKEASREAWILSPGLDDAIGNEHCLEKSARVYAPYVLCRTIEIWQGLKSVSLPDDIRKLLEETYRDRVEQDNLDRYKRAMETRRETLRRLALGGLSRGGRTISDRNAATRYSQINTLDVLLIRKKIQTDHGIVLKFPDDSDVLIPARPGVAQRRKIAACLLTRMVSVPEYLAPEHAKRQIEWLKDFVYLGSEYDEDCPVRIAIVRDDEGLEGPDGMDASAKYILSYNAMMGYQAKKKQGGDEYDEQV